MNNAYIQDEFAQPLEAAPAEMPSRRWSIATLMAARPNPKHDTRATAIRWNEQYKTVKQVQVDPTLFPTSQPEISEEQTEKAWAKLKRLSDKFDSEAH